MHEALEILDRLNQEDKIPYEDYSRLYDLVECLVGDQKTEREVSKDLLDKIEKIRDVLND